MFGLARSFSRLNLATKVAYSSNSAITKCAFLNKIHTSAFSRKSEDDDPPTKAERSASSVFDIVKEEATKEKEYKVVDAGKGKGKLKIREQIYSTANFHVSPRKLRLIANQITKLPITEAIRQMDFSAKRAAKNIRNSLVWARKNAVYQKQMNPDNMFIKLARVGKGKYGRRKDPKARGRFGIIRPPRAHMKYILWEKQPEEKPVPRNAVEKALLAGDLPKRDVKGFKLTRNVWMPLKEKRSVINSKPFYNW
ncbi:39S ribosomal protein L22, mitochondrial [Coemansia spiralis]|uniref:39S ribosomal protein L22, mitochondrial n=2 Tax=Coemansia TaxID=4863 RepID=A0A9W8KXV6_9FUNG|nr:ribosomal protein L22/L17 [Coemansia spiralis]KAJ1996126.1 39S ribosomal protein L22, mitochondrial [Coemansia umbellata]KAJ2626116.1 39S ribosomal protein L22, mitochondrial [Coemansia sp. RSA 1358]KAJ2676257.1 39S ribosomal protein L22, mitochondrial [Coemansia spiralis]